MSVAIIGGGAAGLMCYASLRHHGYTDQILLFEPNSKLGAKVRISGGGRCNVTTGNYKRKELLEKYTRGKEFLKHCLSEFGPQKIMRFFEDHGVPLKVEDDGRVFPCSNSSDDIVGVFERLITDTVIKEKVTGIDHRERNFEITTSSSVYSVEQVVIATGGNAYSHTGSHGDGYAFARHLGHTITPLGPSLNSFLTREIWCHELSGIASSARFIWNNVSVEGPFLFTHFGVSGPAVFALSSHLAYETITSETPASIYCKLLDKDYSFRESYFLSHRGRTIFHCLHDFFPKRLADMVIRLAEIENEKIDHLKSEKRKKISHLLGEGIPITLIQRRAGDEFVTAGGVDTHEINSKTMESRICPGLFFAGEVMNIDGLTGGYNLTSSRATGRVCGQSITTKSPLFLSSHATM